VLSEEHVRTILRGCFSYYHDWRTHLSLELDCPEPRGIPGAEAGEIIEVPETGVLHHHYEQRSA
jgi:putative transposase